MSSQSERNKLNIKETHTFKPSLYSGTSSRCTANVGDGKTCHKGREHPIHG